MEDLTELYCAVDDFWKSFKLDWEKHLLATGKSRRGPEPDLSIAEMMTIVILFHQSNYLNIFTDMSVVILKEIFLD